MSLERLRIAVVDDEADLRLGVVRILRNYRIAVPAAGIEADFEVQALGSAEEFLELDSKSRPDLLLLDQKLPGTSGMELLDLLGSDTSQDRAVIMITAYANLEMAVRATKLGAFDFLAKPFSPDELRYTVRKAATHLILSRKARQAAEEKRKLRFEFLSVLAHELKAPLNAVEGYLDIIKDRLQTQSELAPELGMLERSLIRIHGMRRLIFDLLDLTRIESGLKVRRLELIDLKPVFVGAIEAVAQQAEARQITIAIETSQHTEWRADLGEIEIIANNLLTNAVKYNRDGGSVLVRLEVSPDRCIISVQDSGIGISSEEMPRVFQEFSRIRNEKTVNISGSGLGLSTVKKLAQLYGGTITACSTVNEGSIFKVSLFESEGVNQKTEVASHG